MAEAQADSARGELVSIVFSRCEVTMVLARLALLVLAGVLADPTVILSLADAPLRAGVPPGWKIRNIRGPP